MSLESEEQPGSSKIYRHRLLGQVAARWDAKAISWDESLEDPACHLNEDQAYQRFLEQLAEVIRQRAQFSATQGVIDIGCATGLVLAKVISSFAWGVGIDISPAMIRAARAKSVPNARFVLEDCFKLSTLDLKAGAVVSRGVLLSHYGKDNALELLRNARAVLVTGGFAFLDFLNLAGRDKSSHAPQNKTYYDPQTICELARDAGFAKAFVSTEPQRRIGLLLAESPESHENEAK